MADDTQSYDFAEVRELLLAAFTPEELRRFCQDRSLFQPVVYEFGPGQGLDDMVDRVFDYCHTRSLWDELLVEVEEVNPSQYERFAPRLRTSEDVPPPPPPEQGFDLVTTLQSRWPWIAIGLALVLIVGFVVVRPLFLEPTPTPEPSESGVAAMAATPEPEPTDTPLPTDMPRPTDLRLVDVSVTDGITAVLDIKVRNTGDESAYIKRARIQIEDLQVFRHAGCFYKHLQGLALPPSAKYDFDIRDLDKGQSKEFNISQFIHADGADHFQVVLVPKVDWGNWRLYKLRLELIYNEENTSVSSPPIVFLSWQSEPSILSAKWFYGTGLTDDEILAEYGYLLEDYYNVYYGFDSEQDIVSMARACYEDNLRATTEMFSGDALVLSGQARVLYNEWQKATSDTP
jgi:hypothetical protein